MSKFCGDPVFWQTNRLCYCCYENRNVTFWCSQVRIEYGLSLPKLISKCRELVKLWNHINHSVRVFLRCSVCYNVWTVQSWITGSAQPHQMAYMTTSKGAVLTPGRGSIPNLKVGHSYVTELWGEAVWSNRTPWCLSRPCWWEAYPFTPHSPVLLTVQTVMFYIDMGTKLGCRVEVSNARFVTYVAVKYWNCLLLFEICVVLMS